MRNVSISVAFYIKLATFSDIQECKVLYAKPIYFLKKKTIYERFEESYYFSRILY